MLALSVPLVPSLLMLLRLMSARSYATVTLQSAYMLVEEQADLMATGNNPNVPYAELSVRPLLSKWVTWKDGMLVIGNAVRVWAGAAMSLYPCACKCSSCLCPSQPQPSQ